MEEITKEVALEKLREHVVNGMKENQVFTSICFASENILSGRIGLPVRVRYEHTAGTGRVTSKKEEIMFYPPYDPFTGKKNGD